MSKESQIVQTSSKIMINQKGKFAIQKWKRAAPGIQASDVSTALRAIERTSSTPNSIILHRKVVNQESQITLTLLETTIS